MNLIMYLLGALLAVSSCIACFYAIGFYDARREVDRWHAAYQDAVKRESTATTERNHYRQQYKSLSQAVCEMADVLHQEEATK